MNCSEFSTPRSQVALCFTFAIIPALALASRLLYEDDNPTHVLTEAGVLALVLPDRKRKFRFGVKDMEDQNK